MENKIRVENWCGYDIRFVEVNGEWYAILKDICDALHLRSKDVSNRLDPEMMERVRITCDIPLRYNVKDDHPSKGVNFSNKVSKDGSNDLRSRGENKTRWMLAVNEIGIYEALFASRRLEARKFRRWSAGVMQKLRRNVGLEGYEVMRMTEPEIQEEIDNILDSLYWDEETGKLMQSVTVQGGDVEQVPFE